MNLMTKTDCLPSDAAWALEACKGDLQEAWICISVARRKKLMDLNQEVDDTIPDEIQQRFSELMVQREFEVRKEELHVEKTRKTAKQRLKDLLDRRESDEHWLPGKQNPRPVEDEPWFTG